MDDVYELAQPLQCAVHEQCELGSLLCQATLSLLSISSSHPVLPALGSTRLFVYHKEKYTVRPD